MSKYKISRNANYTNTKKALLATCALLILPLFYSATALAQNIDDKIASIPADNIEQIATRITLTEEDSSRLRTAINSSARLEINRDKYRHPEQTIEFFGIKPDATVIEIWPGQGWYTSILGPYLKSGGGHLIAANFDTSTTNSDLVQKVVDSFKEKFSAQPETYGDVKVVPFGPRSGAMVADGSADAVLTFRNIHNWMAQGWSDKAFNDFYRALKPGGILGIEEHRADDDTPQDPMAADGYVRQDYVISLAKDAGFELVDISEINANPKDTKDHPFGVWTLPPVMRTAPMGQAANPKFDSNRYYAIGESDRMTLLFRKPLKVDKPVLAEQKPTPIGIPVLFGDKKTKKDKTNTKVVAAKNDVKTALTNTETKVEETKTGVNGAINTPIWDKPTIKTTAAKEEIKANIKTETAKVEEVKNAAKTAIKTPNWDKTETKTDTSSQAQIADKAQTTAEEIKTNVTDIGKPIQETAKDVKSTAVIPELPAGIISSDTPPVKPPETPTISDVKTTTATPEVKPQETQSSEVKPAVVEPAKANVAKMGTSKAKQADNKAKPDAKPPIKTTAITKPKASAKTQEKTPAKVTEKSTTKAEVKPTGKTTSKAKTPTKTDTKATAKPNAKNTSKTAAKPATKTASKSTVKPAAKTTTKPTSKTSAATKPASKSKNPNVPDWTTPKKHK